MTFTKRRTTLGLVVHPYNEKTEGGSLLNLKLLCVSYGGIISIKLESKLMMELNKQILLVFNGWAGKNSLLDNFMIFCASYLVYIVFAITVACVIFWAYKRDWKQAIYFFATLVVTYVFLQLMVLLNFDHRPFMDYHLTQLVAHASGKSFPSDHTTVTAGIAFGLLFFTRFKKLGWTVLGAAALIGFARIFVGIHYPLDILGGLVTGLLGGITLLGVKKLVEGRMSSQKIAKESQK